MTAGCRQTPVSRLQESARRSRRDEAGRPRCLESTTGSTVRLPPPPRPRQGPVRPPATRSGSETGRPASLYWPWIVHAPVPHRGRGSRFPRRIASASTRYADAYPRGRPGGLRPRRQFWLHVFQGPGLGRARAPTSSTKRALSFAIQVTGGGGPRTVVGTPASALRVVAKLQVSSIDIYGWMVRPLPARATSTSCVKTSISRHPRVTASGEPLPETLSQPA